MSRLLVLVYGFFAYTIFFLSFLYAIGFVGNLYVSKTIDSGTQGPVAFSIIVNLLVLSVFAVQHSVMARPQFKSWFTKFIPEAAERSTYVLLSSLALILMYWGWQPLLGTVWNVEGGLLGTVLTVLFWFGWLVVLTSTFLINHFDLFGLTQVYDNFKQRVHKPTGFRKILFYRLVRHPIMTGFLIAFWATPVMSTGHLLFAVVTSAYIYIAVRFFEERDLMTLHGEVYRTYAREVGSFFPWIGRQK